MPNISKINALAIGSVGKVDGLAKAGIRDIDGVGVDNVPASAFSVRLLGSAVGISSYTGDCMRVRRASDNVEADVGFDAGELKLTSPISNTSDAQSYTDFADFVDHTGTPTNAFCRYWYDQSGNSTDAGQSTAGSQPKIYDATTGLIEEGSVGNEKPALDFDGDNIFLEHTPSRINLGSNDHYVSGVLTVGLNATSNQVWVEEEGGSSARYVFYWQLSDVTLQLYANSAIGSGTSSTRGDQYLLTGTRVGTTSTLFKNSVSSITGTANDFNSKGNLKIGTNWSELSTQSWDGVIQEIIIYATDQSSNRSSIESDVNGFFSIYP